MIVHLLTTKRVKESYDPDSDPTLDPTLYPDLYPYPHESGLRQNFYLTYAPHSLIWEMPSLTSGRKRHVSVYDGGNITYVSYESPKSTRTRRCYQVKCPDSYGDRIVCWRCHNIK